jgi:hypothetical protein
MLIGASSGTLFGGLVLRLSKIPAIFKVFYFISVSAVTQRALVVNDMECCYLTMTCNSLAQEMKSHPSTGSTLLPPSISADNPSSSIMRSLMTIMHPRALAKDADDDAAISHRYFTSSTSSFTTSFCPPGLQFSGDGSDEGNLGRMYLKFMGLDHDFPFFSLLILFWMNIIFRCSAGIILYLRIRYRNRLR